MKNEKIFVDKDEQGRERRFTARNERDDFWRYELKHPDGMVKKGTMSGSHAAVESRGIQMRANWRPEFKQAGNRGDRPTEMLPDRSMPLPPESPIRYGSK
jgi:hypothetical protein